jgi:hypothetical protein
VPRRGLALWNQQKSTIVAVQFPTPYDLTAVVNGGLQYPTRVARNEDVQIPESLRRGPYKSVVLLGSRSVATDHLIALVLGLHTIIKLRRQVQVLQLASVIKVSFAPHLKQDVPGTVDRHRRAIEVRCINDSLAVHDTPVATQVSAAADGTGQYVIGFTPVLNDAVLSGLQIR